MTKAALTRHPGVLRRPDSNIYQFGLRSPVDLRSHFPSAWAVRCSLGTSDLRVANDKAKALQAEWALTFASLRAGEPVAVDLASLRAELFALIEAGLSGIDTRTASLDAAAREERAMDIQWQLEEAREALANGRVSETAGPWLKGVLKHRSPAADAEAMAAFVLMLEIYLEAILDTSRTFPLRVARLNARRALLAAGSNSARRPATVATATKATGYRIADALSVWAARGTRLAKTEGAFTRHANQFASLMADPILSSIDKAQAIRFRNALQAWAVSNGRAARTADNVMVSISALAAVARDEGWIESNPFEGLTIEIGGKEAEPREPWTNEELRILFNDPIWTRYSLPIAKKAGADAAYWIPLLACFTGARISEIAQLWTDDLLLEPGEEVIEFRGDAERAQKLKTAGSWRAVPMHSELVRLGLPEYAKSLPKGSLFPKLPTAGKNGAGGQFGQWFGDFKRSKGFESSSKTMHSFRHLVATELRLVGATDAQTDAITGHAGDGMGRTVYAATIRRYSQRLRPVIELLRFPELTLRRVYVSD